MQAKVKDGFSQEAFSKLTSLVDYYNKPPIETKSVSTLYINNKENRLGLLERKYKNQWSSR